MTQIIDRKTEYATAGKRTRRQDGYDKLVGRTRYAGDLAFAGLLHARLVLSPYAHARIVNIDTSAALEVPGVKAVYTSQTLGVSNPEANSRGQSPLASKEALWCGHPVAIVLAETEAAAEDGVAAVDVEYEPLDVVTDPVAAMRPGAPLARIFVKETSSEIAGGGAHAAVSEDQVAEVDQEEFSQNVSDKVHMHAGDMEAGWQEAEVIVERTFTTSVVHQSYMEPQSITVAPDDYGHRMTIWPSSQAMLGVRSDVAKALSIPERQIRVESVPIGGAFGGKFGLIEPLAAAAAFTSRKPVRLTFTRSEDLSAGNPAPQSSITLKIGAKNDGTLVAMQGTVIFDTGAYAGSALRLPLL
jgi:CO/xanthine dehydrogenase Mo-binding subunit